MPCLHFVVPVALVGSLLWPSVATASEALSKKGGCAICHAVDKKVIGPSYRDIASKYKGNASALAQLTERVRKGGNGVWGPVPMPASDAAKISDADLKTVLTWMLKTPG